MNGDNCRNRNDIAGQSINIGWHVCLGDTSVQILHKLRSKNQTWLLVFLWSGIGMDLKYNEERPSYQFVDCEWDKLALRMMREISKSKHPVFKCSNIFQTGALMKRTNEPDKRRMLAKMILVCNQLFFAVTKWIQDMMPDSNLRLRIESRRSHSALAHHKQPVCAVDRRVVQLVGEMHGPGRSLQARRDFWSGSAEHASRQLQPKKRMFSATRVHVSEAETWTSLIRGGCRRCWKHPPKKSEM